jgi:hypothetical protein
VGRALVWLLASAYVFHKLGHNWIPHDEGVLGQGAERVLSGEIPHRDFAEVYTGGLDYLHALGFKLFGLQLMSLRYVLFGFVAAWIPVVYYCASRFVSPPGALAATVLSVLWTVPNYPAAMPSWYNLFLATFGAAALLRFVEVGGRRWLVLAGLMGGFSIVTKISGLYYVAGCLLFLVAHEAVTQPAPGRARPGYRWLIGLGLFAFVAALVMLLRQRLTLENGYHFLLPGAGLAIFTWWVADHSGTRPASRRIWDLAGIVGPFLLGLAIPVAGFAVPFLIHGGIDALLRGVFVSPAARLASANVTSLGWPAIVPAILLAVAFLVGIGAGRRSRRAWLAASLGAVLPLAAGMAGDAKYLYRVSWILVAQAVPLVVVAGLVVLVRRAGARFAAAAPADRRRWEKTFLLLALAGLTCLIEYPFAAPIYFCYSAPLALLALIGVLRLVGGPPQPLAALLVIYYAGFALFALNRQTLQQLAFTPAHGPRLALLQLPRAGLLVPVYEAREYRAAVDTLRAHARGSFTYAGPDAPEIYFLAGLRNPTRAFFDFLEPTEQAADRVLGAVDRHRVTAIAINRFVKFSAPLSPELEAAFATRFPHAATVGRFTVRWR